MMERRKLPLGIAYILVIAGICILVCAMAFLLNTQGGKIPEAPIKTIQPHAMIWKDGIYLL